MSIYANKMDNLEEMDNFIEMYNLPKLNQKEIEIMSDQSQVPKIKTLIKKIFHQTKFKCQMASQRNSIQRLEKN